MCRNEWCYCRNIRSEESTEQVADAFVEIFEHTFTVAEEAALHKELGLGTDPQS